MNPYDCIVLDIMLPTRDGWSVLQQIRRNGSNVPVLMLSCAGSIFEHNGKANRFAPHDAGASDFSIALQAAALGLVAHQMGGYDAQKARESFGIPGEYTPQAMIAVGYQAEPDVLDEETRQKELKPRSRKALETHFFEGGWGEGVKL